MRSPVAYVLVCLLAAGCAAPPANQDRVSLIRSANDELLHKGNVAAAREIFTPDYVAHLTDGDLSGGPEVIENFVTELRTAFPDLRVEVEILAEQPDRLAWVRTHRGTHLGDFMGVPRPDVRSSGRA